MPKWRENIGKFLLKSPQNLWFEKYIRRVNFQLRLSVIGCSFTDKRNGYLLVNNVVLVKLTHFDGICFVLWTLNVFLLTTQFNNLLKFLSLLLLVFFLLLLLLLLQYVLCVNLFFLALLPFCLNSLKISFTFLTSNESYS